MSWIDFLKRLLNKLKRNKMPTFKFTVKNFVSVNGKLKQKIVYRFIDAPNELEARQKLDLFPKSIIKCQNYEP